MKCIHYYVGLGNLQSEIVAHIAAGVWKNNRSWMVTRTAGTEIEGCARQNSNAQEHAGRLGLAFVHCA